MSDFRSAVSPTYTIEAHMSGKIAAWLVGGFVLAFFAYAAWYGMRNPPRPTGKVGSASAKSRTDPNRTAAAPTREVVAGGVVYWQVQLPSGAWVDCGGDCGETLRREHLDFWQTKTEEGK
jgi:hypothetical protein